MGAVTQMLTEGGKGKAPAILFDEVPGYPKGYRTLYGQFSTIKRVALTLGLPLEYEHKADIVKAYHHVMTDMKMLKPKMVKTGPIFENVLEGDKSTCSSSPCRSITSSTPTVISAPPICALPKIPTPTGITSAPIVAKFNLVTRKLRYMPLRRWSTGTYDYWFSNTRKFRMSRTLYGYRISIYRKFG